MLKLWNFSSTLGRPNSEEKERKRRLREEQLQQIQKELTQQQFVHVHFLFVTTKHREVSFAAGKVMTTQTHSEFTMAVRARANLVNASKLLAKQCKRTLWLDLDKGVPCRI